VRRRYAYMCRIKGNIMKYLTVDRYQPKGVILPGLTTILSSAN